MKPNLCRLASVKLCVLAALYFSATASAKDGLPDTPYIYSEGSGEIRRDPDMAALRFSLRSFDPALAAATKRVQEQATKVLALLDKENITQKDVVAERISWSAGYENTDISSPEKSGPMGYHVNRDFTVTVRDLRIFSKIVDALVAAGVEEFSSVEADLSNQDELNDQARKKAVADAREQAEKTLQPAGMKIDSLFAISMSASFSRVKSNILQEDKEDRVVVTGSNVPSAVDPAQYRFSPISVSQTARVIYLISRAKQGE